ncbi:hypothetical protein BDA99DRAFT_517780 [Phascolomyces articulosus]|uniref:F-box domain-containing protein n=1 Tax=Phascolomyces articulosus TaxID=60185 RepID=A0AAD5JUU2_9FUNG|nr:hypothetical protein BDA99DRAFT_517780 [Phascolomyces articulosus]
MVDSPPFHSMHILESSFSHDQIQRLHQAVQNHNYPRIVHNASTMINYILEQEQQNQQIMLALLDIRSYAFSMHGQFHQAYVDAKNMVKLLPTPSSISGYARMGNLLSIYGYQLRAIQAYDHGLAISHQQEEQEQLLLRIHDKDLKKGKYRANEQWQNKMDPISLFPHDVADIIVTLLHQDDRLVCTQVSRGWRKWIMDCEDVWKNVDLGVTMGCDEYYKEDYYETRKSIQFIQIADYLGDQVKNITVSRNCPEIVRSTYIKKMQQGHFRSIQSLSLTETNGNSKNIKKGYFAEIPTALRAIQNTLTHLTIYANAKSKSITIAALLSICHHLTDLIYIANENKLATPRVRNFAMVQEHHCLINLEIKQSILSVRDITPLLRTCRHLQRLVLNNIKDVSILDTLIHDMPPTMEMLGVNVWDYIANKKDTIPPLQKATEIRSKNETGLRYLNIQGIATTAIEKSTSYAMKFIQLLYEHRTTLEMIDLELPKSREAIYKTYDMIEKLHKLYPEFKFERIKSLTYDGSQVFLNDFLLQSIRDSTTLKSLVLFQLLHTDKLVNTLITMPPLQQLHLSGPTYIPATNNDDTITGDRSNNALGLVALFERYAQLSTSSASLESLTIEGHYEASNAMLETLAQVKTLKEVKFWHLLPQMSSTKRIAHFFTQIGNQLTVVHLEYLHNVDDDVLAVLGDDRNAKLSIIDLNKLKNITNEGIRILVDKAPSSLRKLSVTSCDKITDNICTWDTKRKMKKVWTDEYIYTYYT